MKSKKILVIIIILCVIIGIICFCVWKNNNENEAVEIMPEEEISDEQFRQTMLSLYYENKETGELMPEARLIDVKLLIDEPYETIVKLLIEEPKNPSLKSAIPNGTRLNKVELKSDVLYIDFSKEFIENHEGGLENEKNTIYSIVNTLTELTEVNGIKVLIDNEDGKGFKDGQIKFNETFIKLD